MFKVLEVLLESILQKIHTLKQDDGLQSDTRRHLSVVYTDLEKVLAYVKIYLLDEESET